MSVLRLGLLLSCSVQASRILSPDISAAAAADSSVAGFTPTPIVDPFADIELKCAELSNSLPPEFTASIATCNDGVIDIPYNSRTYFYDDGTVYQSQGLACDAATRLEKDNNEVCTSYTKGAFMLSGKVLEYDVDLSKTQCGCNAAMYLVGMPTNDERSICGDHYCDANGICGTYCAEIDIMEANAVAWKTVVHHKYDRFGEQYGWGRWMVDERAFILLDGGDQLYYECLYGPSAVCAINTRKVFHAAFVFADTSTSDSFAFQTVLSQEGRSVIASSVKYTEPSSFLDGEQLSSGLSNRRLATAVDEGLTLVGSYWGGPNVDSLDWLDTPCAEEGCEDVFTDRDWPWICKGTGKTNCNKSYRVSNIKVTSTDKFDYNATLRSKNIDTFFLSRFDPIKRAVKDTSTISYRFRNVRSDPAGFMWTPLESVADWIIMILYLMGVFVLNVYTLVRLNNIIRAIIATRFFRSKSKEGGLIPKGKEPVVTLQICCYNERNVIKNSINAACAVDWPRNKLVVQILDDSTDESVEFIEQTCARMRELGFNCHRLERSDRVGYKAGNLQSHFDEIQGDFVGLFDADHLCERDFLRRCVPQFFDRKGRQKKRIGLVQCPWAYYNIHSSMLTEYDALNLDSAFVIEQTAREHFLGTFSFNGTGGLWRKQAIIDAGGWSWETVTEDLYISYQAAMAGYKFVYLRDVPQVLEVPAGIRAHLLQKNRWTKGYWQVTRKTLWTILSNPRCPFSMKFEVFFQYTASIMYAWTLLLVILAPALTYRRLYSPLMILLTLFPAFVALLAGIITVFGKDAGNHTNNYRILLARLIRLRFIPLLLFFALGVMVFETYAIYQGLTSNDATFLRTPKEGVPRVDGDEEDDESVSDRIDYNLRMDMEEEEPGSPGPSSANTSKSWCCGSDLSDKDKAYRTNIRLGWSGILLSFYLIGWALWLYFDLDPDVPKTALDYCMIFSLAIPSFGLLTIHGSYLRQMMASRVQQMNAAKEVGGSNASTSTAASKT